MLLKFILTMECGQEGCPTYGYVSPAKDDHDPRSTTALGETGFRVLLLNSEWFDTLEGDCTTEIIIVLTIKMVKLVTHLILRSSRRKSKKNCTARNAATEPTNIARVFNDKPETIMLAGRWK
jgi:hypothetical protein